MLGMAEVSPRMDDPLHTVGSVEPCGKVGGAPELRPVSDMRGRPQVVRNHQCNSRTDASGYVSAGLSILVGTVGIRTKP